MHYLKKFKFLLVFSTLLGLAACESTLTPSMNNQVQGSPLSLQVKSKLIQRLGAAAGPIQVQTFKDEVRLSGVVPDELTKRRASLIVRSIPDIRRVQNDLIIKQ